LRYLYTLIFYFLTPFLILRLGWRGLGNPAYWQRWGERFGRTPVPPCQGWVHAVSLGEVQAALPLIGALLKCHLTIMVTTMTPTGAQRLREVFGEQVQHVYLPYDLPGAVNRFLTQLHPQFLVLMETELWPNLLDACHQRQLPVILANARLSAQSAKKYQRVKGLMREMLNALTVIAAQTQEDAEHFLKLGAGNVQVTGNIKFDSHLPAHLAEQVAKLRQQWGVDRLVWIAASTHEGEEEQVLEAFAEVKKTFKQLLLVLVPRHPERFKRVASLCKQQGYLTVRRSEGGPCLPHTDIYLGDTLGELPFLYAACDVALVGGSLVPVGGHNLMEPAAVGLPIIIGPHVFEWAEISRQLLQAQGAVQVQNVNQLTNAVRKYLGDATLRRKTGEYARTFVEQNRGALERLWVLMQPYLK